MTTVAEIKISIVIVAKCVDEDFMATFFSAISQDVSGMEVIVKLAQPDLSDRLAEFKSRNRIIIDDSADSGIYNAMNRAVSLSSGKFLYFLNVGDKFVSASSVSDVFTKVGCGFDVIYSNYTIENLLVSYPKKLSRFFFLRNALCHQSYFIRKGLFAGDMFDESYQVLADHECIVRAMDQVKVNFTYSDTIISHVAPMGFSAVNRQLRDKERRRIERTYFSSAERFCSFCFNMITMRPIRLLLLRGVGFRKHYFALRAFFYKGY